MYIDMIIRCIFNKPWPHVDPKLPLPVGRFSVEKIVDLGLHWAKIVDLKHPGINFAEVAGLQSEAKTPEDSKELDLQCLRKAKRTSSDGPEPDVCPKFKRGDEVTMVRRMSWCIPQAEKPQFRKDIVEGTPGVIEGYAELEERQVLCTVILDLPSGPKQSITRKVCTRNLKLTSEYLLAKAAAEAEDCSKDTEHLRGIGK